MGHVEIDVSWKEVLLLEGSDVGQEAVVEWFLLEEWVFERIRAHGNALHRQPASRGTWS